MRKFITMIFILAASVAVNAASISVQPLDITFNHDGVHFKDAVVKNVGKTTAYVKVTLFKLLKPGAKNQKTVKENKTKAVEKFGLIATPDHLVIKPGQAQSVRFMPLDFSRKVDEEYFAYITPMTGDLVPVEKSKKMKNSSVAIKVTLGYRVRVAIRPDQPSAEIRISRTGKELTIQNIGNSFAILMGGKQCNPKNPKECKGLTAKRVYPNETWKQNLPFDGPLSYNEIFMGSKNKVTVK